MSNSGKANGKSGAKLGQLIDDVTVKASEDWSGFMKICDIINSSPEGPKEAVKCIRKRFATKQPPVIILTLALLETCVKQCGMRFQVLVANKDFLHDFMKVINAKNSPSMDLQMTVLGLLQTWALAFQGCAELQEICKTYQDLKKKNVEFPPIDLAKSSEIFSPTKQGPNAQSAPSAAASRRAPTQGVAQSRPKSVRSTDLRSELSTIQQSCQVFVEMLSSIVPGTESTLDWELLMEMNMTCRQMQQRIVQLLATTKAEEQTVELLSLNDELNGAFRRYDKCQRAAAEQASLQNSGVAVDNLIDVTDEIAADNNLWLLCGIDRQLGDISLTKDSSQPQAAVVDSEYEIAEMKKWVMENEGDKQSDDGINSDFELFLQARAKQAEGPPHNS